jgi:hypothetical protein
MARGAKPNPTLRDAGRSARQRWRMGGWDEVQACRQAVQALKGQILAGHGDPRGRTIGLRTLGTSKELSSTRFQKDSLVLIKQRSSLVQFWAMTTVPL